MEWKKVPISSICEGIYEGPHATPPSCESGAYYLGIPALTSDGQIDFSKVPRICEKDYKKWTKRVTPKYGDIVFTNEATLNLYARIPMDFYGCLGRRLGLVRPLQDKVDVDYLFYYFFSPYWRKVIALKKVSGSTVERILMKKFPHFPVLLPPLNIQNKIASILSDYDNLIENNNKRIRLLEQMAENIYKEWFVRFRFPGHEKAEFENGLPKGWSLKNLFDVADVSYGYAFKSDLFCNDKNLNAVVRIRDIQDNHTDTYTSEVCDDKYLIEENAILVGMDGLFHMCLWNGEKAYLNQRVVKICSKKIDMCNYMLFMAIRPQIKFWEQVIAGTTVAHLGDKHLKKIKIAVPTENLLLKANESIQRIMVEKNQLFKQNQILTRERDLLLPRLMSGKLEVNV